MNNIGEDWIIAVSSSEADGIDIYRFRGDDQEVKKKILELLRQDKKDDRENHDESTFDYGTTNLQSIEVTDTGYYAYAIYEEYHIDYVAKRWCDVDFI